MSFGRRPKESAIACTFGSFRLLKDLPLDFLKIDGELVESLAESRTSQLIVKALVDVANALEASLDVDPVVAERRFRFARGLRPEPL